MKVGAHPLVVAAALGLLGPLALASEDESSCDAQPGARSVACPGCTCGAGALDLDGPDRLPEGGEERALVEAFAALSR